MSTNPAQRSFADGEIAPALYARTDHIKYIRGLRTCRNMIVQAQGGALNRSGLRFITEAKDSALAVRLIDFVLDGSDVTKIYLMEFGDSYIRFYQNAARVTTSGVSAWANTTAYVVGDLVTQGGVTYYCTLAHTSANGTDKPGSDLGAATKWYAQTSTIYEIPTPYATAHLGELVLSQRGDVVTITHPNYAPRELQRYTSTRWTLVPITFGPAIAKPTNFVRSSGGTAGATQYWAVTAVKDGTLEESLPAIVSSAFVGSASNPVVLTWDSVPGAVSYNLYRSTDQKTYGLIQSAGGTTIAVSDTTWGDSNEVASIVAEDPTDTWTPAAGQCRNALTIGVTTKPYNNLFAVKGRTTLATGTGVIGGKARGRLALYYSRDSETRVLYGYYTVDPLVFGVLGATQGPIAFEATIEVPDNGYVALTIDLVPEVWVDKEQTSPLNVTEIVAVAGCTATLTLDFGSAPNNTVDWASGASTFSDAGNTPDFSLGPPQQRDLFSGATNIPAVVGDYQQRRIFGGSQANPEKVWGSRTGSQKSFTFSTPLQPDDTVSWSLVGKLAQTVKHFLDLAGLLVFTTAGVHQIGGDGSGILRPDAVNPKRIAKYGIGRLPPLEVAESALYVGVRGNTVRDLLPVETSAGLGSYRGTELSLFSAHLFKGYTIVDWAYAEQPFGIVYAVRSDGILLALTYLREFGIWGWHRHDTDGLIENVCVVPEGDEDAVYLVVNRTIDGATKRYLERFTTRFYSDIVDAVFMDAAITVDGRHTGTTTMTLSGGSLWDDTEQLTLTASVATFSAADVGNAIYLYDADGALVRCTVEAYTSTTVVTVRPDRAVPATMQDTAVGDGDGSWGRAIVTVDGLDHLEGAAVAVLGDGFVLSSPNNADDERPALTVSGGEITLPEPAVVIQVGLPYVCDLETLDLDRGATSSSKNTKKNVNAVGVYLNESRGVWAGRVDKWSDDDLLAGLEEMKPRQDEGYDLPPALVTDYREIVIGNDWNSNGRILVRQVDPLPMHVLSLSPIGVT